MTSPTTRAAFPAMSTTVEIVGVGVPAGEVERAAGVGRRLAAEWEARFSRFRPDSQLSRLNAADGRPRRVDATFIELLAFAAAAVGRTGGRFDPAVLPALEAAGYDRNIESVRSEGVAAAGAPRPAPGPAAWEHVRIDRDRNEVRLPPGMRLDLGGVAKGAFVDRLAAELAGWPGGCVDAGGDLRLWGRPPSGDRWAIGIEDPAEPAVDLLVVEVLARDGIGVATSATNRRAWRAGGRPAHHLIDPRSGRPLAGAVRSATAFAPSVAAAEIATKASMVAAAERAPLDPIDAALAVVVCAGGRLEIVHGASEDASNVAPAAPDRRSA